MRNPFRRSTPPPPPPPAGPVPPDVEEGMRQVARERIRPGFNERSEVLEVLVDWDAEDVDQPSIEAAAHRVVDEEWAAREAELAASAPGADDHERLARAFDALQERGILGRMNFTCCQTCGTAEIGDERTDEWGYTFFHQQDAERLVDPEAKLYLSFSAFASARDTEHSDATAGRTVHDELVAQGLDATWDGSEGARIEVAVRDWRRPLPTD